MTSKIYQAVIDRPLGYQDALGNTYPVNYGYIPNLIAGDGEEQGAYVISATVGQAITEFEGRLAAIIHRRDDNEDKWVLTGRTEQVSLAQIIEATHFLEQYFDSWIELV
ncbi:TPA: inorganic pyrophosphatase [Streptococcus suis]